MALVEGRADHGIGANAEPTLAGIGLGAGIAIVTTRTIRHQRIWADTGGRIASPHVVALVLGRACHGTAHAVALSPGGDAADEAIVRSTASTLGVAAHAVDTPSAVAFVASPA